MKVLILARGIPSKENPQEGCFEWDQARALKSCGVDVVVMALDARMRTGKREYGITKRDIDGIPFYKISWGPTTPIEHLISFKLSYLINNFITKKLLINIKNEHPDIDIIHAHYLGLIHTAISIRDVYKVPIIGTEHWSELAKDKPNKFVEYFGPKTYKYCSKLIAVSDYLRQCILQQFRVDSVVCGNVLGQEFIKHVLAYKTNDKTFTFIACGSLVQVKGFDLLIKAFSLMKDKNCRLIIIGEGPERSHLQNIIESNNLSNQVELIGRKSKLEIIELMDKSDCFVMSSHSETFGVAAIEALSRGLPVISTHCGGIEGIVNDSNGMYVDTNDVRGLSRAMYIMKQKIIQYNPDIIRENCLKEFSPKVIAHKLINIYNETIENKNS